MDLSALKTELLDASYSGLSDSAAAGAINTATISYEGYIEHTDLMTWAASGPRKKLETGASNGDNAIASACLTALDLLQDGVTRFDTSDAANKTLLGGLKAAGIITGAEETALLAIPKTSRRAQLGWREITESDVAAARAL